METPTAPRRQVLLVLGMHRSGTSATAGLLAQLGARMAANPMRADSNNPHGYWESDVLFRLHDHLLAEAGSAWDDWGRLDTAALEAAGGGARAALAAAFAAEFPAEFPAEFGEPRGDDLAVMKDPRICRFLPLWRTVLADVGALPRAVLPLRHPRAVAASLAARDGMAAEDALLLWLRHALEAEAGSRDLPRVFLHYDDLLADWRAAAARIAATLGVAWPLAPEAAAPAVEAFLSRDLRHHDAAGADAALPDWAAEGWAALSARAASDGDGDAAARLDARLDALRAALDAGDALMGVAARRQARAAAAAGNDARAARAAQAAAEAARASEAATAAAAHAAEAAALRDEAAAARDDAAAVRAALAAAAEAAHALEARVAAAEAGRAAEAAARAAERAAFLSSRSWRMTAPLRRAAAGLRRRRPDEAGTPGEG